MKLRLLRTLAGDAECLGERRDPCADAFKTANPNVNVKITQLGWDDYWSKLTNGFIAGDAPDVFTDHLSKYPEFVSQQQLLALDETLTKDGFNVDQYQAGLADLWKAPAPGSPLGAPRQARGGLSLSKAGRGGGR